LDLFGFKEAFMNFSIKKLFFLSILVILTLTLSACGSTPTPVESTSAPAASAAPATEAPLAAAPACPVGNWQITDFSGYMSSLAANLNNMSTDVKVTDQGYTGTAKFTFNPDGTSKFTAENFVENFSVSMGVSGTAVTVPVAFNINGSSTADYIVEGDQITFTNQDTGDLTITYNMSESEMDLSSSLLGEPGTVKLYQFACADQNTLSLKVTAITNMDLAPLILTRIP
jgi:hypothetical protein